MFSPFYPRIGYDVRFGMAFSFELSCWKRWDCYCVLCNTQFVMRSTCGWISASPDFSKKLIDGPPSQPPPAIIDIARARLSNLAETAEYSYHVTQPCAYLSSAAPDATIPATYESFRVGTVLTTRGQQIISRIHRNWGYTVSQPSQRLGRISDLHEETF